MPTQDEYGRVKVSLFDLLLAAMWHFCIPFPALQEQGNQIANQKWSVQLLNLPDYVNALNLGIITREKFTEFTSRLGFSEEQSVIGYGLSEFLLTASDYLRAFWRGEIEEQELTAQLTKLRMSEHTQEIFKSISEYFPTPSDLITMAVREVFSPDIANKYGLYEDIPQEFLDHAREVGLPIETARWYWAAHWQLPSATQGYEMMHRGIISYDDLQTLLRSLDYMPYWRDKLSKMSYNVVTRVDARRMYGLGILDEDGVYKKYLAMGYAPDDARALTEFTVKYESNEADGITRASVVSAYQDNIITRDECIKYLKSLKYTDKIIEFWMSQADYDKIISTLTSKTQDIVAQYNAGAISEDDVRIALLKLDVPSQYVKAVMDKLVSSQSTKLKLPSKDELTGWLEDQYIDEKEYTRRMRMLGYRDGDIQIYLARIAAKQDTSMTKILPVATYQRWLTSNIMNKDQFFKALTAGKVPTDDITRLYNEAMGGKK